MAFLQQRKQLTEGRDRLQNETKSHLEVSTAVRNVRNVYPETLGKLGNKDPVTQ